jgi:manganese transport protein
MTSGALSARTALAGQAVLAGTAAGRLRFLPFAGPAFVASVAYIDPGNIATNIRAGAEYGYTLLWVVVVANLMAMMFQALSAKVGIVTGRNLAELCREAFPRPVVYAMWVVSEIAAMATDLAELLGAAIGLSLLFGLPLLMSVALAAALSYAMLMMQRYGFRPLEILIAGFVAIVGTSYLTELVIAPPDWQLVAFHAIVPQLRDGGAVILAVGIVGATVMPHAVFLHSSLTQERIPVASAAQRRRLLSYSNREVMVALGAAGLINMAMVTMAASVFQGPGATDVVEIETAYRTLIPLLGTGAATVFLLSLLASGFSSTVVGTMAGQVIMQGFVAFAIPLWVRRVATMLPSLVVVALGFGATDALVLSQVVLSLILPVPLIALVMLSSRRSIMGEFANGPLTRAAAIAAAVLILGLNALLLAHAAGLPLPAGGPPP